MKKILIVSAACQAGVLLTNKLKGYGLDSYVATTGRDCLDIIESNEIYAAVIDNSILDMEGSTLLELVAKLGPELGLVFVNDHHDPRVESHVRQAGIAYYATDMQDAQIVSVILELVSKQCLMHPKAG